MLSTNTPTQSSLPLRIAIEMKALNNSGQSIAFKSVKFRFLNMKALGDKGLFQQAPEHWGKGDGSAVATDATTSTWFITNNQIPQELVAEVRTVSQQLQFKVCPKITLTDSAGKRWPEKFIIAPKGSFSLQLVGDVNCIDGSGIYVVQLMEDWSGIKESAPLSGQAETFLKVELVKSGSMPPFSVVTEAESDTLQAVLQT